MDPNLVERLISGTIGGTAVLGIVFVCFMTGWLYAKPTVTDLMRQRDKWESIADRALTVNERYLRPEGKESPR